MSKKTKGNSLGNLASKMCKDLAAQQTLAANFHKSAMDEHRACSEFHEKCNKATSDSGLKDLHSHYAKHHAALADAHETAMDGCTKAAEQAIDIHGQLEGYVDGSDVETHDSSGDAAVKALVRSALHEYLGDTVRPLPTGLTRVVSAPPPSAFGGGRAIPRTGMREVPDAAGVPDEFQHLVAND